MKRKYLFFVCLPIITALYGCGSLHSDIPLVWKPSGDLSDSGAETLSETTNSLSTHRYKIMKFTDVRKNKKEIAKNIENKKEKLVTTRDDVADWCTSKFKDILNQRGLSVVEDNASVIITGEILQFYVIEGEKYKGDVRVKISAENASGKILWQGILIGNDTRFGRSYKLDNYYETLSDAYLGAVKGLLKNAEFNMALSNKKL